MNLCKFQCLYSECVETYTLVNSSIVEWPYRRSWHVLTTFLSLKSSLHIQSSFCITCFKWGRPSILKRRDWMKWLNNFELGNTSHIFPFTTESVSCSVNSLEQVDVSLLLHFSTFCNSKPHRVIWFLFILGKLCLHSKRVSWTVFCKSFATESKC